MLGPTIYLVLLLYVGLFYSSGMPTSSIQQVTSVVCLGMGLDFFTGNLSQFKSIINAKNVIIVGIFYWILLDGLMSVDGLDGASPQAVYRVYMMILTFLLTFALSRAFAWPKWSIKLTRKLDRQGVYIDDKKMGGLILFCFVLAFMPVVLWGGGWDSVVWAFTHAGRWNAKWARSRWGESLDYIKTLLSYFLVLALQLSWFYMIQLKKWFSPWLAPCAILGLWMVFITGTRNYFVGALAPFILLYYFKSKCDGKQRLWAVLLAGFLMLSLAQLQLQVRDADNGETILSVAQSSIMDIVKQNPQEHSRDYQLQQLFIYADLVPQMIAHSGEWIALRPLYHFVPRFIWKNKPEGITRFFEEQNNADSDMTTFAGSIIGDFYICQGFAGVALVGLLMGFLVRQFDYLTVAVRRSSAILFIYSYGLMFLFTSIRSYQIIYEGWFIFVLFYFVLKNTLSVRVRPVPR